MEPDDHVCLCYRVSLRKLANYARREQPTVASQLSECLGAGTGCGWCRPVLQTIFERWRDDEPIAVEMDPESYATARAAYRDELRRKRAAENSSENPDAGQAE